MRTARLAAIASFGLVAVLADCGAPANAPTGQGDGAVQEAPARSAPKCIVAGVRGSSPVLVQKLNANGGGIYQGTQHIEYLVNAGLLVPDTAGQLRPQLAEAAPTLENGLWRLTPDGRMETTW